MTTTELPAKVEVGRKVIVHVCGHGGSVPIYEDDNDEYLTVRVYRNVQRKCPECRQSAVDQCIADGKRKKSERKERRRKHHEAKEARNKQEKQESQRQNIEVRRHAVDELLPGTIIELVCLESGRWWGRIRRQGFKTHTVQSGRPVRLLHDLAEDFSEEPC